MNSHPFFMQRGERSDTRIHTNSPKGTAERRSREADRIGGATNRKQDDVSSEGATNRKRVTAQRPEGAKHRRDKYKGQPNGGADPPKWGERGRTPKSATQASGFPAKRGGRNRSEARTREGDGREKN